MKILIITSSWYGGGAESIARETYKYCDSLNYECYYAYARNSVPDGINGIRIGNDIDLYSHVLYARLFDGNGFGSKNATRKFIKKIEEINPDIIHIHNPVCYALNIEILFEYLKNSKAKVIWTLHDCWSITGHCIFFDEVECDHYKKGCRNCLGQKEYPKSILIDRAESNLTRKKIAISDVKNMMLVTPSSWLANIAKTTYLNQYKIKVINNGIDTTIFKPTISDIRRKYGIEEKKIILGVASRWTKRKGLNYFIGLSKIIDISKYQIVLIGINNKEQKKLPEEIIAINRTNSVEELAQWYTVADMFINPTLADNFPTVNLEALACGTPVITFDTGGSWESVGDECGVLVKEKSPQALYDAVKICSQKNFLSEVCINKAKQYESSNAYKEYVLLYNDLMNT